MSGFNFSGFNAALYEELEGQIQAQFRDANLGELIKGIIEIKKKYLFNAYNSLIMDNISITTAKGIGLDLWGRLLHLDRAIPSEGSEYSYFNFNKKTFYKLSFYNENRPNYSMLSDNYYRKNLVMIYQGYFIFPNLVNVNVFANDSLREYGTIMVRDTTDMSFQVYVFTSTLPDWLKFMFNNYDILPRPAGVGNKIIERVMRRFGFAPDKPYKKPDYSFFNFNDVNFNKTLFYNVKNNYGDNFRSNSQAGKDISQDEYNRRYEWASGNISGFYKSTFYNFFVEKIQNNNSILSYNVGKNKVDINQQ